MPKISPNDLIAKFRYALENKWGYIYGTAGQLWTEKNQAQTTNTMAIEYGSRWIGHRVTDCSGLFSWAFDQLGGFIAHGSNSMYRKYAVENGPITSESTLKPGYAVYKRKADTKGKWPDGWDYYHVGLYIGNNTVIEAQGTRTGVVTSKLKTWKYYSKLKGVDYDSESSESTKAGETMQGFCIIDVPNDGTVNVRAKDNATSKIITTLLEGTTVNILEDNNGWCKVEFTMTGYIMSKFVKPKEGT